MTPLHDNKIKDVMPESAWMTLKTDPNAMLVDCRTAQEWAVIGHPDLAEIGKTAHLIEWKIAPDMRINPAFAEQVDAALFGTYPEKLFFICRSGVRSKEAATVIQAQLSGKSIACECINVAEGFEGHRGSDGPSGWRDKDLPMKHN